MALIRRCIPIFTKTLRALPTTNTPARSIKRWVSPTMRELKRREDKQGGKIIKPRNTFLEWNLEAELYAFAKRLNEQFDTDLLMQAFTDRSYVVQEELKQKEMEFDIKMKDNIELANKGETFMKEYIQLYLEHALPKLPIEGIKAVRDHLLSEGTLAHVSAHLGTKDIILASTYPVDTAILATTLKALVGALHQSSGELKAAHFVRDFVITQLQGQDVNEFWTIADPWSMLTQILGQEASKLEPRLIGEAATNTLLACYRVGLYADKKMISSGFGESVAIAKEMAAREALKKIFGTEEHMAPINYNIDGIPKQKSEARYQIASS